MRYQKRSYLTALALTAFASLASAQQPAADYPSKPIRVIVPYVAGGPMDFIGRTLGQKIAPTLGQNFVIENRPGAGGSIGADHVAKAAPDGYTMLLTSSSHASLPVIMKSLSYDSIKDFSPITLAVDSVGFILVANPKLPAKSVQELIAMEKANPGTINYGSAGNGNVMHLAAESFNQAAGIKMNHVPYKGVAQALTDLIGGRIDVSFVPPTAALQHIKAGTVRALGIGSTQRWSELPDVPTIDETVKGYKYGPFYGFWFPAGTPKEYTARIQGEIAKALQDPAIKRAFADQGFVPVGSTPEAFAKTISDEMEFNRKLVSSIGLEPQ